MRKDLLVGAGEASIDLLVREAAVPCGGGEVHAAAAAGESRPPRGRGGVASDGEAEREWWRST